MAPVLLGASGACILRPGHTSGMMDRQCAIPKLVWSAGVCRAGGVTNSMLQTGLRTGLDCNLQHANWPPLLHVQARHRN